MRKIIILFIVFGFQAAVGQVSGKIIDAETNAPIPYVNIQINGSGSQISNAEGFFTIPESSDGSATVVFSYIGYAPAKTRVADLKNQSIVALKPLVFELDEVTVAKLPTANAIMATVKKNLVKNYGNSMVSEDKLFVRKTSAFAPKVMEVEVTKSTGFKKNSLRAFNSDLAKMMARAKASSAKSYTDMLFQYYTSPTSKSTGKMEMIKATKLVDAKRSASIDGMQDNFMQLLLKHLDTTKFYRAKSGLFGSQDTISLTKKSIGNEKKTTELAAAKSQMTKFLIDNNFLQNKNLDFVTEPDDYEYTYEGAVYLNDNDFAYVLSFKPDRRRAKYAGKLYISDSDFAVIRADYGYAAGKTGDGINMKLLLGVKFSQTLHKATLIYKQNPNGTGYHLQYGSVENGQYMYLNRPLKFIEIAKDDEDVVALDIKIEGTINDKIEFLDLSRNEITSAEFDKAVEKEFKYQTLKQYDPQIWKDYGAIEPLEEMKRYKVLDEASN